MHGVELGEIFSCNSSVVGNLYIQIKNRYQAVVSIQIQFFENLVIYKAVKLQLFLYIKIIKLIFSRLTYSDLIFVKQIHQPVFDLAFKGCHLPRLN